ncbi:MAG: hypothetical protein RJA70_5034 [Pseudomonadota bacterium]|jgi:hypothetical protein
MLSDMLPRVALSILALALCTGAALAYYSQRGAGVVVAGGAVTSPSLGALEARCPKGTLEDDGACIPVPEPVAAASAGFDAVPKLPERPQSLDAYLLPTPGTPALTMLPRPLSVSAAISGGEPWPAALNLSTPALLIESTPGSEVHHRLAPPGADAHSGRVLATSPGGKWLLVGHELHRAGNPLRYLALYIGIAPDEGAAKQLTQTPSNAPLGKTTGITLLISFRQLRPGKDWAEGLASWSAETSIGMDPRNVLPLQ